MMASKRIKSTFSFKIYRFIVTAALLGALAASAGAQTGESNGELPDNNASLDKLPVLSSLLDGSWHSNVSSVPPGFSFKALLVFTPGALGRQGSLIETDDTAFSPSTGLAGAGIGAWIQTGDHKFAFTFKVHSYDTSGNLAALETVSATITVEKNGDTFTGRSHYDIVSPSGASLGSGDSTFTAHRIRVERLSSQN